jgi:hypothetical protein
MKYSQQIGIAAAILLIANCFLPWIEITTLHKTITGANGYVNENYTFGKQIIVHSFFCGLAVICFSINKVWAKRTNIFLSLMNFAWAIKNFAIFKLCRNGDCPEVKMGLYNLVILALIIQVMALLPKMYLKK